MTRLVAAAVAVVCWPSSLASQSAQLASKSGRIERALVQIRAHNVDSAAVLLEQIINSSGRNSSERAEAYFWLGVTTFYRGTDSAAASAFRNSLQIDPFVSGGGTLASLDSTLAVLWEREQTLALCGEDIAAWLPGEARARGEGKPMNGAARHAEQRPELTTIPRLRYPDQLRQAGIEGHVLVRVIIDAEGRTEPVSVQIVASNDHGFEDPVKDMARHAHFSPAMSAGSRVRSCAIIPVDFTIKR